MAHLSKGVAPLAKEMAHQMEEVAHLEIKEANWEDH
jgi:hypothetical protein